MDSIILVPIFFISTLHIQRILVLKRGCRVFLLLDLQFHEPQTGSVVIKDNNYELAQFSLHSWAGTSFQLCQHWLPSAWDGGSCSNRLRHDDFVGTELEQLPCLIPGSHPQPQCLQKSQKNPRAGTQLGPGAQLSTFISMPIFTSLFCHPLNPQCHGDHLYFFLKQSFSNYFSPVCVCFSEHLSHSTEQNSESGLSYSL